MVAPLCEASNHGKGWEMSKQVDVLAVLDETYGLLAGPAAEQLEAARDAVAELIEASKFALDKSWEYGADEPHFVKLNVAIARCNGGAA